MQYSKKIYVSETNNKEALQKLLQSIYDFCDVDSTSFVSLKLLTGFSCSEFARFQKQRCHSLFRQKSTRLEREDTEGIQPGERRGREEVKRNEWVNCRGGNSSAAGMSSVDYGDTADLYDDENIEEDDEPASCNIAIGQWRDIIYTSEIFGNFEMT